MQAGGASFVNTLLGLSSATESGGTTFYTRDNRGTLVGQRTLGGRYYYLFDALGSVLAVTDASGAVANRYAYDPYAGVASTSGTVATPWRFGGADGAHTDTATGLVKIGARYYDPQVGRWTQQDPLTMPFDPVQANRYSYAGCNPVNYIDPTGLHCGPAGKIGLVAGAGAAYASALYLAATFPVTGPVGPALGLLTIATVGFLSTSLQAIDCFDETPR